MLYERLSPPHIRLLRVVPAPLQAQPIVWIETYALESAPLYVALSYTWGEPDNHGCILTIRKGSSEETQRSQRQESGRSRLEATYQRRVRLNLRNAFSRLQTELHRNGVSHVWVDAICINQVDLDEKAAQIPLIGKIFAKAEHVLVWLGQGTVLEGDVLQRVANISMRLEQRLDGNEQASRWFDQLSASRELLPPDDDVKFWCGFLEIMFKPWFNRVWVVQEVCVGVSINFLLGSHTAITWDALMVFVTMVRSIRGQRLGFMYDLRAWRPSSAARREAEERLMHRYRLDPEGCEDGTVVLRRLEHRITGLLDGVREIYNFKPALLGSDSAQTCHFLLRTFRGRATTYEEDIVYAMAGLLPAHLAAGIEVDFRRAPVALFKDLARQWWMRDPELSFLHWIDHARQDPVMPSWALDFRALRQYPLVWHGLEPASAFCAGISPSSIQDVHTVKAAVNVTDSAVMGWRRHVEFGSKNSLKFRAIELGTVASVSSQIRADYTDYTSLRQSDTFPGNGDAIGTLWTRDVVCEWLRECHTLAFGNERLPATEAFWRTLVLNKWSLGFQRGQTSDRCLEDDRSGSYDAFLTALENWEDGAVATLDGDALAYFEDFGTTIDWAFIVTADGRFGRAPPNTQTGDKLIVIEGVRTPFLLRSISKRRHRFLGEACVHGMMYGEVYETTSSQKLAEYIVV